MLITVLLNGFDPTRGYYHIIIKYNNITIIIIIIIIINTTVITISIYSNKNDNIANLQYFNNFLFNEFNFLKYVNQTSGLIDEVLFDFVSLLIGWINSQKALG